MPPLIDVVFVPIAYFPHLDFSRLVIMAEKGASCNLALIIFDFPIKSLSQMPFLPYFLFIESLGKRMVASNWSITKLAFNCPSNIRFPIGHC